MGKWRWIDLRAAVISGLLAGLLFCAVEVVLAPLLLGESAWGPLRKIAAIVLGPEVLADPAAAVPGLAVAALALHLALSVLYACIGCLAFHRIAHGPAMLVGVMLGFVLYIINFYGFVAWFPWFEESRSLMAVALHLLFGVSTAVSYHLLRRGHWRHGAEYAGPGETHLRIGRFPIDIEWNPAVWAALVSGTVFMVLEMILTPLVEGVSPWRPMHMIAGIALGGDAVPPQGVYAVFSWRVLTAALLVHFTLSLIYSVIGSTVFRLLPMAAALGVGLLFGLALYTINFYGFAQVFVWFQEARGWPQVVVHLVYGVLVAGSHKLIEP
jgi:hypothetical protein